VPGLATIALLAGLVLAGAATDAPAPASGARLEVPEPVHDAGKVDRGVTLRHAFVVKNPGTAPLAIDAKPG
jgi:hypothetical protein